MKKEKFYAVKKGRKPGIYRTWAECSKQVNKFSGAKFKSFDSLREAENYLGKKMMEKLYYSGNTTTDDFTTNHYVPIVNGNKVPRIYINKKMLKKDFPNATSRKFKSRQEATKYLVKEFKMTDIKLIEKSVESTKPDNIKKCVICQKPIRTGSWYCPTCKKKTESLNEFLTENHNLKYPLKTNFIARMRFCEQTDKDIFEFIRENPKSIFKYFYMEKEYKNEIRQNYLKDRKKILEVSIDNIPYYIKTFFMDNTDKELLDIYGTEDNPILKVKCLKCNKEYTASFKDISKRNLHPCDVSMSSGEYKVKSFLESKNIKYLIQRDTLPCKNPVTGHILPYDFELPEQKLIIEVQGEQHTHFISFFHSSKEAFEYQQFKDNIKKEFAIKKGYKYLEIFYDDFKTEDFKNKIIEKLTNKI